MKTVSTDFHNGLALGATGLCYLLEIVRKDGTTFRYTTATRSATFDGHEYTAGGFDPTDITSTFDQGISQLALTAYFTAAFTEEDVRRGKFDDATAKIYWARWDLPGAGRMGMFSGVVESISVTNERVCHLTLTGNVSVLSGSIGEVRMPTCRADFGDARCKIDSASLKAAMTVTVVSSEQTLILDKGASSPLDPTEEHEWWAVEMNAPAKIGDTFSAGFITKLEFHETIGGSDAATGGDSLASEHADQADNAFDADNATQWKYEAPTARLGYHFASAVGIKEFALRIESVSTGPAAVKLLFSDDGETWTTLLGFNINPAGLESGVLKAFNRSSGTGVSTEDAFGNGSIKFTSGLNDGLSLDLVKYEEDDDDPDVIVVRLATRPTYVVAEGDTVDVYPGCDKTLKRCKFYDNVVNFRGEPYVPTPSYQGQNRLPL